jgi:hypothetical protein
LDTGQYTPRLAAITAPGKWPFRNCSQNNRVNRAGLIKADSLSFDQCDNPLAGLAILWMRTIFSSVCRFQ